MARSVVGLRQTDILLFSYGTLQDEAVQLANFGRLLSGRTDSLPGYSLLPIAINDPAVVADYTRVLATLKSGAKAWVYVSRG